MGLKEGYALIDDHGELLGYYLTRGEAESDLEILGDPPDVGIVELKKPEKKSLRQAALRFLTRLAETFPGGYR